MINKKSNEFGPVKEIVKKELKNNLLKNNLVSVILFGSAVKSVKKANDYDIFILTKKYPKNDFYLAGKIKYQLLKKIAKPVDIIFLKEEDLNFPSPILYEIQASKLVFGKDLSGKIRKISRAVSPIIQRGVKIGWKIAK
ncbi:MAG: nucleotidyltransferase domain-containing protein [Nanoarchaeota archaeon]